MGELEAERMQDDDWLPLREGGRGHHAVSKRSIGCVRNMTFQKTVALAVRIFQPELEWLA